MSGIKDDRADWANYWRGRTAQQSGEVFAGVGIETSTELQAFWKTVFDQQQAGPVLDVACGAGSAIKHAAAAGYQDLIGLDISEEAISETRQVVPSIMGITASSDHIPIANDAIGHVVSQFGFEYADRLRAASEISRVLQPAGQFTAIVHQKSGAIAAECAQHLERLQAIDNSQFIPAARAFCLSVMAYENNPSQGLKQAADKAMKQFLDAQACLGPIMQSSPLATHLHKGAKQLFERRQAYLERDIVGWFDGMSAEIDAFSGRMTGMLNAAISEQEAILLLKTIAPGGTHQLAPFLLGERSAAWALSARCC